MRPKKFSDAKQKWFKQLYARVAAKNKYGKILETEEEVEVDSYISLLQVAAEKKKYIIDYFYRKGDEK